ncbi:MULTISPECIES: hypothetical protein [Streptomyces]|uniref:hypothetical protein n=1 Tax=Streptomyces TaxID=1883 RepID=UPI00117EA7CC|nr:MULTISPECIES: hypothetical protein [Streptomyces]MDX3614170.1 hypothetical protein [Streptomyces europaeiscabiei]MDX3635490.1 hypothetical protein [Streptomyces europaeiscabiei]MDX3653721.1 hypothetical protein [Streptomyces europaeiscabiei]
MNISLFPVSAMDVSSGFERVINHFHLMESDPAVDLCDLGEDGDIIEQLLLRAKAGEIAELAVSGGTVLGDDEVGTVCMFLSGVEVELVAQFFSSVSSEEVMRGAPDVLSSVIRGAIPEGYMDGLRKSLADLWHVYDIAARQGLCVAQVYEG